LLAALCVVVVPGCSGNGQEGDWPQPNRDLTGARAAADAEIDSGNVSELRAGWRFGFDSKPSFAGRFASTPLVDGGTVFVQDLQSNVFALDRETGRVRWTHLYRANNNGPNGIALADDRVFGATDSDAFALDASTGRELWRRHLTSREEQYVEVAPVASDGLVYLSTVGFRPFGRGAVYALDADDGAVRWKFVTIKEPWRYPLEAGGGGFWNPVSVDSEGRVYGGNSNPSPWGGSPERPNGAHFPGPALYTDSLLVLEGDTGRLVWHDQVTPHDVRDYDFQATPILADDELVIGAGKAGLVIAWNRDTHERVWTARVGLHRNDVGPLPRRWVTVCPGLYGGLLTQLAYADDRVFAPVVDLCSPGSAIGRVEVDSIDVSKGKGRLVALDARSGRKLWERRFPSPNFGCATVANDVVFTSTYDGNVYAFAANDGSLLWQSRMRAGINACPAVAGDLLLVGAGASSPGRPNVYELVAFRLE
jgi:outer membrane protein assembly factor BamB